MFLNNFMEVIISSTLYYPCLSAHLSAIYNRKVASNTKSGMADGSTFVWRSKKTC